MTTFSPPLLITTQDRSGNWQVTVNRGCGHKTTSPARFPQERMAEEHGNHLLRVSRCLTCAVEERSS